MVLSLGPEIDIICQKGPDSFLGVKIAKLVQGFVNMIERSFIVSMFNVNALIPFPQY